jgi:NAD(P)-dependent dehydrogenase (short-subunit alcohol dehydrogenase family)
MMQDAVPPPGYDPAPDLLAEQVVLITGAGDGIGRAVALACARHGATVVLLGRTESKLEAVYDAIEEAGGPRPALSPFNLETAPAREYELLLQHLEREFGRLDGLVSNAAMLGSLTPVDHYDPELWLRVLQVNLNAPFMLARTLLPLLRRSAGGSLVLTSADPALQGRAYWGAYGVSCAGVESLARILADEAQGEGRLRVNAIDPGPVATALRRAAYPAEAPSAATAPEAVAPAYLYLLGADSADLHGRRLRAQG